LLLSFVMLQGVDQYRLQLLASDVQQAVQALGHSSCTLVAHDWGGLVAWVVAGMYGRQVGDNLQHTHIPILHPRVWQVAVLQCTLFFCMLMHAGSVS
jgi:hypothetical protein